MEMYKIQTLLNISYRQDAKNPEIMRSKTNLNRVTERSAPFLELFLLIKYTILEPMSLKISQIDFSLIQHLQVDSYAFLSHGFRFRGEGAGSRGGGTVATLGQNIYMHTYVIVLQIHQECS